MYSHLVFCSDTNYDLSDSVTVKRRVSQDPSIEVFEMFEFFDHCIYLCITCSFAADVARAHPCNTNRACGHALIQANSTSRNLHFFRNIRFSGTETARWCKFVFHRYSEGTSLVAAVICLDATRGCPKQGRKYRNHNNTSVVQSSCCC